MVKVNIQLKSEHSNVIMVVGKSLICLAQRFNNKALKIIVITIIKSWVKRDKLGHEKQGRQQERKTESSYKTARKQ